MVNTEKSLMARLPEFILAAQGCAAYAEKLRGVDAARITTRAALAELPITRKSDLIAEQEAAPIFGGHDNFTYGDDASPPAHTDVRRFYLSPGPIAECDFAAADYWGAAAAFRACGFGAGMLLHNSFSYHFTPAGFMCDEAAAALGGRVFPAGPGNSERQARAMAKLRPDCYSGTPDFLATILARADEAALDVGSVRMASVSGGFLSPELREAYAARGIAALQWYGSADVGCIAYETAADAPMTVVDGLIVEVVDAESRQVCGEGEKGEVVVTNLNARYPLLRLALGDLSAVVAAAADGRMRLAGWLGRCDAAVKARGMLVYPAQIARLVERRDELAAAQLVISRGADGRDRLRLRCVLAAGFGASVAGKLEAALADEIKLKGEIAFVGKIPAGDLVIDQRSDS